MLPGCRGGGWTAGGLVFGLHCNSETVCRTWSDIIIQWFSKGFLSPFFKDFEKIFEKMCNMLKKSHLGLRSWLMLSLTWLRLVVSPLGQRAEVRLTGLG